MFTHDQIKTLFPFHILIDADLVIIQTGKLIEKLVPDLSVNAPLLKFFNIDGIHELLSFEDLSPYCNKLVYMDSRRDNTSIKGAFYPTVDPEQLIFIGNITPTDLKEKHKGKISLQDFPVYDAFVDYLFSHRAHVKAYQELQEHLNMSEASLVQTKRFNHQLEQKVNERTTELVISQKRIKQALKKEKELGLLKSRFIATASHEFRTPVSIIQSNSELLSMLTKNGDNSLKDKLDKATSRINHEVSRLIDLMDDVLIINEISTDGITVHKTTVNLVRLFENMLKSLFSDDRIEFQHKGEIKTITIDVKLISHAITNVLKYVIKNPDHQNPLLVIDYKDEVVTIIVEYEGAGIPEKEIQDLFNPFHRPENSSHTQGNGLGLAITKKYIDLVNGDIHVKSTLNEDTTFTINIPYA